jgi:hypothetical protein
MNRTQICLAAAFVILVIPLVAYTHQDSADNSVVHGTINIALGNENGIVVLTDSMITAGGRQLAQPGKKLFKLDDQTVCAFAGFSAAPAADERGSIPELNTSVGAVIEDYARKSQGKPRQSIVDRLGALAFLINFRLTALANAREALGHAQIYDDYNFRLLMAGTDVDNLQKIATTALHTRKHPWGVQSSTQDISVTTVEDEMIGKLAGMPDVALQILTNPESKPTDPVLSSYANARRENNGKSLTLDHLQELAKRLAYYTAQVHPEVGGPNQIAILRKSQIVTVDQPKFAALTNPITGDFGLAVHSEFRYSNVAYPFTKMPLANLMPQVYIDCNWVGSELSIDGGYFIANTFADSVLYYDGSAVSLWSSNKIINSKLVLGPHAKGDDKNVKALTASFQWSQITHVSTP